MQTNPQNQMRSIMSRMEEKDKAGVPKEDFETARDIATDSIPGVSETKDIISLGSNIGKGDYVGAGIDATSLALGAVPVIGDAARQTFKRLAKNFVKTKKADVNVSAQDALKQTDKDIDTWKAKNQTSPEFQKRLKGRNETLQNMAQGLENKLVTKKEYREAVDAIRPIRTVKEVPKPANFKDTLSALDSRQRKNPIVGVNYNIPEGDKISARLDITAYTQYDTWIPTLKHEGKTMYKPSVVLKDVTFIKPDSPQVGKALKVATGKPKAPFAVMEGKYVDADNDSTYKYAKKIFKDKDVIQVGYDPTRRGYFYDRATGNPILEADEVVQVGHLVLAKKAKLGNADDFFYSKGGTAMKRQMEMFEDGGLKDEGGMVDEVSGNDVPPGSTREEVRDDIPAQLSEGEFVFPADVVRYIGLEKLMKMRQQAKQGLKAMEEMGQMGNSEEATIPDDLPFDETDLDIEDDLEYNRGGVVYAPGDFAGLMGGATTGPQTQNVRYYNEKLRQVRIIPHFINADGSLGGTIYPVPDGFVPSDKEVPQEEEEKEETTQQPTVRQEEGGVDSDDVTGDLGGARTTIGGEEYAISYGFDGSVSLQSVDNYKATGKVNFQPATPEVTEAIKDQTKGQLAQLGKVKGLSATVVAEVAKKMGVETPRYDKLGNAIKKAETATLKLDKIKPRDIFDIDKAIKGATVKDPAAARVDNLSRAQVTSLQDAITTGKGTDKFTAEKAADIAAKAEQDRIEAVQREEKNAKDRLSIDLAEQRRASKRIAANRAAQEKAEAEGRVTGREAGMSMGGSDDPGDSGYSTSDDFDSDTGFGSDISTAVGGLIPRKKKKTKKMKRGGLASKK